MINKNSKNKGLTLIEMIITLSILSIIGTTATMVFVNIKNIQTKSSVKKEIQEELKFLMERIVQDIKNHTIDYRGYYVLNGPHSEIGETSQDESNLRYIGIPDAFPSGGDVLNPAPNFLDDDKSEDILILLNNDGTKRIKYTLMDPDGVGEYPNAIMMSEQTYSNTGNCHSLPEVNYDSSHSWNTMFPDPDYCWVIDSEYPIYTTNNGYLPLSSTEINITALEFYFSVHKSPYKVYEEDEVQFHPLITIKITGRYANEEILIGTYPELTLQTTVAARNYQDPVWATN